MYQSWPCPLPNGGTGEEHALCFDSGRTFRVLVIPPFFDDANKLRRTLCEVMRRLDLAGFDSVMPDLPGQNESLQPLTAQTLPGWQTAAADAAENWQVTHVLSVRSGALAAPASLPGWRYAAQDGARLLRNLIRARLLTGQEAGMNETRDDLMKQGREHGLTLSGWAIGPEMFQQLELATPEPAATQMDINQGLVGGGAPWLRAEPDDDPQQADALAAAIAVTLAENGRAQ